MFSLQTLLFIFALVTKTSIEECVVIPPSNYEAYRGYSVAMETLAKESGEVGISMKIVSPGETPFAENIVVIGRPEYNPNSYRVYKIEISDGDFASLPSDGFVIKTLKLDGKKIIVIVGGSPMGEAYGIFWLLDKIKINRCIPEINCKRAPKFQIRQAPGWGKISKGGASIEEINTAFRYGLNWVSGLNILALVPWDSEEENKENEVNRAKTRKLIEYAHSLGMKYFAFSNEFTYHPSLFKETNGKVPSPCEEVFWTKLQEKYDRLFSVLPELDGVEICLDDISGFWGNYKSYDLLHSNPECKMCYEDRYKTFLKKLYEVIVKKHHKIYFHNNWGLREYEIHCQPDVYKKVFTDDIPVENLYVIIKITRGDRWWYQQFNSTFNLTAHRTVMRFEPMNYYEGRDSNIFPTFSGEYFQCGLQYVLSDECSNLSGISFTGGIRGDEWSTQSMYVYFLYRLMFEPDGKVEEIAKDFCAQVFSLKIANDMAKILLDSASCYKYGLHIEPISYGRFNSLLHMRVGEFVTGGYPMIDLGKEHIKFLREIYLKCEPWREATINQLQFGVNKARLMLEKFKAIPHEKSESQDTLITAKKQMEMTYHLIQSNYLYFLTILSFFDYLSTPIEDNKSALAKSVEALLKSLSGFKSQSGFNYKVDAIELLIEHANSALNNIEFEKNLLRKIPNREEIENLISYQQRLYEQYYQSHRDSMKKIGTIDILVDGQDLIIMKGDKITIRHMKWDPPILQSVEVFNSLPSKKVIVIPVAKISRSLHPFVLSQPSETNDYTASIYIDDKEGGMGRFLFDVYMWEADIKDTKLIADWKEYIETLVKY